MNENDSQRLDRLESEFLLLVEIMEKFRKVSLEHGAALQRNDDARTKEILDINRSIVEINENLWPLVHKVFPDFSPGSKQLTALLDRRKGDNG